MIDIEKITPEIIEALKPLNPDKIILFGSYAYGKPNEESDIDLFLIKNDIKREDIRRYSIDAHIRLKKLIKKYKLAFDVLAAKKNDIEKREDYFYKVDILKKGKVLYAK
ncbi:MAG: nucleotidyltransferase domain-containing protein [Epsilonproteobacteria bacterium]|nr:nucleotidyltransferase domain-containing protein [Campylobacterota bacterium]